MVFSKNYDNSLWLMVYGDDVNRDKISLVIKNISFELLVQIQELIKEYNIDNISRNISYVRDNLRHEVSIYRSELSIKMIKESECVTEEIELFILPCDEKCIRQMKVNDTVSLGGFTSATYNEYMKFGTMIDEYEMVKTCVGSYIKLYTDNSIRCINRKRVNLNKLPDSFNVHQLRTEKSIKRLVRGKR